MPKRLLAFAGKGPFLPVLCSIIVYFLFSFAWHAKEGNQEKGKEKENVAQFFIFIFPFEFILFISTVSSSFILIYISKLLNIYFLPFLSFSGSLLMSVPLFCLSPSFFLFFFFLFSSLLFFSLSSFSSFVPPYHHFQYNTQWKVAAPHFFSSLLPLLLLFLSLLLPTTHSMTIYLSIYLSLITTPRHTTSPLPTNHTNKV